MANAGYRCAEKREELAGVKADWLVAELLGKHPRRNKAIIQFEKLKACLRAKVKHPFRIINCQFCFVKARYKGLLKNDHQLAMLFALANLVRVDLMINQ